MSLRRLRSSIIFLTSTTVTYIIYLWKERSTPTIGHISISEIFQPFFLKFVGQSCEFWCWKRVCGWLQRNNSKHYEHLNCSIVSTLSSFVETKETSSKQDSGNWDFKRKEKYSFHSPETIPIIVNQLARYLHDAWYVLHSKLLPCSRFHETCATAILENRFRWELIFKISPSL